MLAGTKAYTSVCIVRINLVSVLFVFFGILTEKTLLICCNGSTSSCSPFYISYLRFMRSLASHRPCDSVFRCCQPIYRDYDSQTRTCMWEYWNLFFFYWNSNFQVEGPKIPVVSIVILWLLKNAEAKRFLHHFKIIRRQTTTVLTRFWKLQSQSTY